MLHGQNIIIATTIINYNYANRLYLHPSTMLHWYGMTLSSFMRMINASGAMQVTLYIIHDVTLGFFLPRHKGLIAKLCVYTQS